MIPETDGGGTANWVRGSSACAGFISCAEPELNLNLRFASIFRVFWRRVADAGPCESQITQVDGIKQSKHA